MIDFKDWAVIGYNDDTGIGNQLDAIKSDIGITRHLVIPSKKLVTKPLTDTNEVLIDKDFSSDQLEYCLQGVRVLLFIETLGWHEKLFEVASKLGIKTVCLVNWEWFNPDDPNWRKVDFLAAATRYTISFLKGLGFSNLLYLPPPIKLKELPVREIKGNAQVFFHNAGIIDDDDRKGTFAVIRAFQKVKLPDIKLIVRTQSKIDLPVKDRRITVRHESLKHRSDLYTEGQVAIQPSKLEGVGFNILEPVACGIPTITMNCDPMREWVSERSLLVKPTIWKKKSFSNKVASVRHAYLKNPSIRSLCKSIEWCTQNELSEISKNNRNYSNKFFECTNLIRAWKQALFLHNPKQRK